MPKKVALIKLAAMGDVVLACRALRDFDARFEADIELHWIIDQHLIALAEALLAQSKVSLEVQWHPLDAQALFQGGLAGKAAQAARMLKTVARINPRHVLLLHRDWRYQVLLRPVVRGSLSAVNRQRIHELDAYEAMLSKLARRLKCKSRSAGPRQTPARKPNGKIGILVGGAQNQKLTFSEKRWPRYEELVSLILKNTAKTVTLFGGGDDRAAAQKLLSAFPSSDRIFDFTGKLKLHELPAALAELDAFVSIDSGLGHIASMVMTAPHQRVVSLFGPTDPGIWAPKSSGEAKLHLHYKQRPCAPCYLDDGDFKPCKFEGEYFQHCMTAISPEEVLSSLI